MNSTSIEQKMFWLQKNEYITWTPQHSTFKTTNSVIYTATIKQILKPMQIRKQLHCFQGRV